MKVSVIMPAKDRANLIEKSIRSVLDQTFSDFELIVINDHSSDNTAEVVNSIQDPRIKLIFLEVGTGPGAGRDFGIKNASGEIMIMTDSDDINVRDRFEKTVKKFELSKCDVVYGSLEIIDLDKNETRLRPSQEFDSELLKLINFIPTPAAAFTKDAYLESGGFNPEIKTSEDYDLWLSLAEKNKKFCFLDEILVQMNVHEQSTTKLVDYEIRKTNLKLVREKHGLKTPNFEQAKKLIRDNELLEIFSTEHQRKFWFED